jgi:hypothetical protein
MRIGTIRHMLTAGALALGLVALTGAPAAAVPTPTQEQQVAAAPVAQVTGTFTDALGGAGTATGTFVPSRFFVEGDRVLAEGVLDLVLVDSAGQQVDPAGQTVSLPVTLPPTGGASIQAICQVLDLVLGPLDLDLLGLQVHLDTVHLNISAESGPGNLVGNLLCAIAGLLDGVSPNLQALVILLNAILALLSL